MANIEEITQTAAPTVGPDPEGSTSRNEVTNVVKNFIPITWLGPSLSDAFKYASIVKQVFIMQAGVTVKMRRTMDAAQRNLDALLQYNAWVENLEMCYPHAAINKYMRFTTKTMRKEYSGRDVFRKFGDGLQIFQNVFNPTWNVVIAGGISGKTWPEVWQIFVGKLVGNEGDVSSENLSATEFKQAWLLAYKFLGPPCEKLYRGMNCHELFSEANLQSTRGTGSRKRKVDKLSRKDEREDYARRTQSALQSAVAGKMVKSGAKDDNVLHMNTVMRGVEMLAASRKNEFDMLAQALQLYGPDDPRANKLKDTMFELLCSRRSMGEQITEVQQNLQKSTIDLTGDSPSYATEDIDPMHAAAVAPPNLTPNPISPISIPSRGKIVAPASIPGSGGKIVVPAPISGPITEVKSHACLYPLF